MTVRRFVTRIVTVALVAVTVVACPAGAHAISRARAGAIALRAVGAERLRSVLVLGPTAPLAAGSWVADVGPDAADQRSERVLRRGSTLVVQTSAQIPRLRASAWLMWVDEEPYAYFEHRSAVVLVDVRSGRVVLRRTLAWWPLVNGGAPSFARPPGYGSARYRVLARGLRRSLRRAGRAGGSLGPGASAAAVVHVNPVQLAPGVDLSHDCFVLMGDSQDPQFQPDFGAIRLLGAKLGVRYLTAFNEASLRADLVTLTAPGQPSPCNDVVLFLNGHGLDVNGFGAPIAGTGNFTWGVPAITLRSYNVRWSTAPRSVDLIDRQPMFDANQLESVLRSFPRVGFKILALVLFPGVR